MANEELRQTLGNLLDDASSVIHQVESHAEIVMQDANCSYERNKGYTLLKDASALMRTANEILERAVQILT